jgi:hypothetical protein
LRYSLQKLEKIIKIHAKNLRNLKRKFKNAMSKSIDNQISIMLKPNKLKTWLKRWMNLCPARRKCMRNQSLKFHLIKMRLIWEKKRLTDSKDCWNREKKKLQWSILRHNNLRKEQEILKKNWKWRTEKIIGWELKMQILNTLCQIFMFQEKEMDLTKSN